MPKLSTTHQHNLGFTLQHLRLPARRIPTWLRYTVVAATSVFAVLMVVQMAYPRNITTPLLKSDAMKLGGLTSSNLESRLQSAPQASLTVTADKESYQTTFSEAGISVDVTATKQRALTYSWRERLTPFSLFRRTNITLSTKHDEQKLRTVAEEIALKNNRPAVNAVVKQVEGRYAVTAPSAEGLEYQIDSVVAQLKDVRPTQAMSVAAAATPVPPKVSTAQAEESLALLAKQTSQRTEVKIGTKTFQVPADRLKKFISITYNEQKGLLQSSYDKKAITNYMTELKNATYVAAVPTVVSSLDGAVTSRTTGKNGQTISVDDGTKRFIEMLKKSASTVDIPLQTISSTTQFTRNYSPTSRGLQVLLQDWQSDNGITAGVVVRESGGRGRSASLNGNQAFLLASISKLYLVNYLYDGIAGGTINANSKYGTSSSVAQCLESLIVVSDNACFNNLGNALGWAKIGNHTVSQGFTSTNPNPAAYTTTAFDTALYFDKLQNGSLVASSQRTQLIGYMQRQIYRTGIPLGSRGTVANKVGYHGGYRHDAGIVYHPRSTYTLVVLTSGGTNAQISDLARRISIYMDK